MQNHYEVIVSGGGPGGLAVAWEAAKQDKTVLIICDRGDYYIRNQSIILGITQRIYLECMFNDNEKVVDEKDRDFLDELDNDVAIPIKKIERYIKRRIDALNTNKKVVDFKYYSKISSVDSKKDQVVITSSKPKSESFTCGFNYLIGSDGAKHETADKVNASISSEEQIVYSNISKADPSYHGSFYVRVQREDGGLLSLSPINAETKYHDNALFFIFFKNSSVKKSKNKSIKCQITAEIPHSLYLDIKNNEDKEDKVQKFLNANIQKWSSSFLDKNEKVALRIELVKKTQKNHDNEKNTLGLQAFELNLNQANKVGVVLKENVFFLLMGDAYRTPDYQIGHGLNDALEQAGYIAIFLSEKLNKGYNNMTIYQEKCSTLSHNAIMRTDDKIILKKDVFSKEINNYVRHIYCFFSQIKIEKNEGLSLRIKTEFNSLKTACDKLNTCFNLSLKENSLPPKEIVVKVNNLLLTTNTSERKNALEALKIIPGQPRRKLQALGGGVLLLAVALMASGCLVITGIFPLVSSLMAIGIMLMGSLLFVTGSGLCFYNRTQTIAKHVNEVVRQTNQIGLDTPLLTS